MTVVEAHVGGIKLSSPDDSEELSSSVCSLLFESIAQNTTGNVYEPEVTYFLLKPFTFFQTCCV